MSPSWTDLQRDHKSIERIRTVINLKNNKIVIVKCQPKKEIHL